MSMHGVRCAATREIRLPTVEMDVRCTMHDYHTEWGTPHIARDAYTDTTGATVRITFAWDLTPAEDHGKLGTT